MQVYTHFILRVFSFELFAYITVLCKFPHCGIKKGLLVLLLQRVQIYALQIHIEEWSFLFKKVCLTVPEV